MPFVSRIAITWRNLSNKDDVEQELGKEHRAHVDLLIDQKIREGRTRSCATCGTVGSRRRRAGERASSRGAKGTRARQSRAGFTLCVIYG